MLFSRILNSNTMFLRSFGVAYAFAVNQLTFVNSKIPSNSSRIWPTVSTNTFSEVSAKNCFRIRLGAFSATK